MSTEPKPSVPRYIVMRSELIAAAPEFADLEEALGQAQLRTKGDLVPRTVVRALATLEADTTPTIIITEFAGD